MTQTTVDSVGSHEWPGEIARQPIVLTPHPLQRVGAFAAACLIGLDGPQDITLDGYGALWDQLTDPLIEAASAEDAKQPGGFWLSVSYMLWPNSKMNTTNRKKLSPSERRALTAQWRSVPAAVQWPGQPCVLCGRAACGFYGKVDVPLAASVEYRNTSVPGHDGIALCVGCLASFYALPHGCLVHRGRLSVAHSWDDAVLRDAVSRQVRFTTRQARGTAPAVPDGGFEREQLVLDGIRNFPGTATSGVSLMVFTNSNKEQQFTEYPMSRELTGWVRRTAFHAERDAAYRALEAACATPKVSGRARLARLLVSEPASFPRLVAHMLREALDKHIPMQIPASATGWFTLTSTYADEVMQLSKQASEVMEMSEQFLQEIQQLGANAAQMIIGSDKTKPLDRFVRASKRPSELRRWINEHSVEWLTQGKGSVRDPFISERQKWLLFDYSDQSWLYRDVLFTAVIAELQRRGFNPKGDDAADARDSASEPASDTDDTEESA